MKGLCGDSCNAMLWWPLVSLRSAIHKDYMPSCSQKDHWNHFSWGFHVWSLTLPLWLFKPYLTSSREAQGLPSKIGCHSSPRSLHRAQHHRCSQGVTNSNSDSPSPKDCSKFWFLGRGDPSAVAPIGWLITVTLTVTPAASERWWLLNPLDEAADPEASLDPCARRSSGGRLSSRWICTPPYTCRSARLGAWWTSSS